MPEGTVLRRGDGDAYTGERIEIAGQFKDEDRSPFIVEIVSDDRGMKRSSGLSVALIIGVQREVTRGEQERFVEIAMYSTCSRSAYLLPREALPMWRRMA